MRKIILIFILVFSICSLDAQIQSLEGPRLGMVYISTSPGSTFLNGDLKLEDLFEIGPNYDDIARGAITSLYGWQWESRFADGGGDVTGIVEWIALAGGMDRGKFLPSLSSMVGARTSSGFEFAIGPNLSLSGISMVFGLGYNFKSGNLNLPINIAFVPGRQATRSWNEAYYEAQIIVPASPGNDGLWGTEDDIPEEYENTLVNTSYEINYNTGSRFSITLGFNMAQ